MEVHGVEPGAESSAAFLGLGPVVHVFAVRMHVVYIRLPLTLARLLAFLQEGGVPPPLEPADSSSATRMVHRGEGICTLTYSNPLPLGRTVVALITVTCVK